MDQCEAQFPVTPSIRLAAEKLTSYKRREFQAEMALKYCGGSPRVAEDLFGWRRTEITTGLGELRTGIRCVDNTTERGRKRTEVLHPQLEQRIRELAETKAQVDSKFQTTLTYTS